MPGALFAQCITVDRFSNAAPFISRHCYQPPKGEYRGFEAFTPIDAFGVLDRGELSAPVGRWSLFSGLISVVSWQGDESSGVGPGLPMVRVEGHLAFKEA